MMNQKQSDTSVKKRKSEEKISSLEASKHPKPNRTFKNVLSKHNVNDVLVEMKDGSPIVVHSDDSIYRALSILLENKISGAPVMDWKNPKVCVGFVDMMDINAAIIDVLESSPACDYFSKIPAKSTQRYGNEDQKQGKKQRTYDEDEEPGFEFIEEIIIQSISARAITDFSQMDRLKSLSSNCNLHDAALELSDTKHQRVAIVDPNGEFRGIITQSGFIEYILEEHIELFKQYPKKVGQLVSKAQLSIISADISAFEAFKTMKEKKISSFAICNKHGTLIDVISASDLTLWTEWVACGEVFRFSDFSSLKSPVAEYLESSRAQRDIEKRPPVTCKIDALLEDIVADMLYHHVHRVYVVDENDYPISVVSYADIIWELLQY